MKILPTTHTSIVLAAAALLAAVSAASAASPDNGKMAAPASGTASAKMTPPASTNSSAKAASAARDELTLTQAERKKAWNDLYTPSLNQKTPSGFHATIGAIVPSDVVTAPVTARAAGDVPALKPYKFAMVQKKLVIVNPSDSKIADVIAR
jgi:Spy/CpxP family protein refolding chaperone